MKSKIAVALVFGCLFATSVFGDPNTQISFEVIELGLGRWQYTYNVTNKTTSLTPEIEEFTIWFGFYMYDNLVVTTPETPAGWNQIVWDPEPVLQDDGAFDALADPSFEIEIGESVSGFAVSFDWLGTGQPGSQLYHIVDSDSYTEPIEVGWTVPEPTTLILFGLGVVVLLRRRRA